MRRLALAIALGCVLSGVARGGEIHSTGVIAPSAPGTATATTATTTGENPSSGATATQPSSSTVVTIILTLISIVR